MQKKELERRASRAVRLRDQDHGLDGGLPRRMVLLGLRQLRDVVRRILELRSGFPFRTGIGSSKGLDVDGATEPIAPLA